MLVEIHDKIVSTQIFERKFVCDLNACKGACCVHGDAGAPLTIEEADILEEDLEKIKPYMRPEGISAVNETGVFFRYIFIQPINVGYSIDFKQNKFN